MSDRLKILRKARHRMVEDQSAFAKTLAAPFDRDNAERARTKFVELQTVIEALDRAILSAAAEAAEFIGNDEGAPDAS